MTKILTLITVLASLSLTGVVPVRAQSDLRAEIESLKEGQARIESELAAIKKLLLASQPKKPAPFKPQDVTISGSPFRGSPTAKITLVEFTDYQCPFCKRHAANTYPQIIKNYVETGQVKYVQREFPLKRIHPRATRAAEAALCAGEQNKYWEMHDKIFEHQKQLGEENLAAYAAEVGADSAGFKSCMEGGTFAKRVAADLRDGAKIGVRGTPSFVFGLTDPNDDTKIHATKFLRGAQPYAAFEKTIKELLESKSEPVKKAGSE